ncbi:GntR family transcriptional regulator, partial [Pseudooceanicola nanhaiensis]|uniref:GntR family transcriptional regulator n=1 Tax=Pseudooceanicola nanhaiensis TaxID=375761 RepID=UPI003009AE0B
MTTQTARILIVEDDAEAAAALSAAVRDLGCEPVVMQSYEDGLRAAGLAEFRVIVFDRMLPGGDGIDAIAKIRAAGSTALVLVVSALGRAANKIEGLEKGAMLPSEAELCQQYGVSRITIRAAIGQLVERGLLVRRPGVGTFVTGRSNTAREFNLVGFLEEGRLFTSEPVSNEVLEADARLAELLDLAPGAPVRHIRTAVHREGEPLTVADGYSADTPEERLSEEDYRRPVA